MKVVLDTNVLVSGLLTGAGACGRILDLTVDGALGLCIDGRILQEYRDVLGRAELAIGRAEAEEILNFIEHSAEPVAAVPLAAELPDPEDLPFLEVAATGQAILVTGNRRHFPKRRCAPVNVVSPRELLDLLRRRG